MGAIRLLALAVPIFLCLALASTAVAIQSFTWTGAAPLEEDEGLLVGEEWSAKANWEGEVAPEEGGKIGTLTFPVLESQTCLTEEEEEEDACYFSYDDLKNLSADSMVVEGDDYLIFGDALTLGSPGLRVAPAASPYPAFDGFLMPFDLAAPQTWRFTNQPGGEVGETEVLITGPVTGSKDSLTVELSNGVRSTLIWGGIEVGSLRIAGSAPSKVGALNGTFWLAGADINAENAHPVSVEHIFLFGSGSVGTLTSNAADIWIGEAGYPVGGIDAASASFNSSTGIIFPITDNGTTAEQDYSQLTSTGPIELGGAAIEVVVRPPVPGKPCPTLTRGQTYTFVSTTGTLSGAFANAPEWGPELPIRVAAGCSQASQTMRIHYHKTGPVETVTGIVEEAAQRQQEEEARKLAEERGRQLAEEFAQRKREEEAAKHQALGSMESAPDTTIVHRSVVVSHSGVLVLKIKCPPGETSCTGTITLRTLHAVSAGKQRHGAKHKSKALILASAKFTVAGGQTKAVRLHLSHKARRLLARAHLLSALATIVAGNPSGATHTTRTRVTLHQRSRRHQKG